MKKSTGKIITALIMSVLCATSAFAELRPSDPRHFPAEYRPGMNKQDLTRMPPRPHNGEKQIPVTLPARIDKDGKNVRVPLQREKSALPGCVLPPADMQHQKPAPGLPRPLPMPRPLDISRCENRTGHPLRIVCILDRSGSMYNLTDDSVGGYNSFIDGQKRESAAAIVTTVLFNHTPATLYESMPISAVTPLTAEMYSPRGNTALLDAVGGSISSMKASLAALGGDMKNYPVIFMIMTDGRENASREYSVSTVKKMISDAGENYGWQFIFMGANIDSVSEAGKIGISADSAVDYAATGKGVKDAYNKAGSAVRMYRSQGKITEEWKK